MQLVEKAACSGNNLFLLYRTGEIHPAGALFCLNVPERKRTEISVPSQAPIEQFSMLPGGKLLLCTSQRELWKYSPGKMRFLSQLPESPLGELLQKYGLDHRSTLNDVRESGMVKGMGCLLYRDRIMNMFPYGDEVIILTSVSILRYHCDSGDWDVLALPHFIPKTFRMPATLIHDRTIYQGTCLGEDGGDLKSIDINSGTIKILYSGTQVTSVMQDPQAPDRALFSTGTWHLGLNKGGIYRTGQGGDPFFAGKAVYSMTSNQQDIIAASREGIYRIHSERILEKYNYPDHLVCDGIGVVGDKRFGTYILTGIYRQRMVCGAVPLFVEPGKPRCSGIEDLSTTVNDSKDVKDWEGE